MFLFVCLFVCLFFLLFCFRLFSFVFFCFVLFSFLFLMLYRPTVFSVISVRLFSKNVKCSFKYRPNYGHVFDLFLKGSQLAKLKKKYSFHATAMGIRSWSNKSQLYLNNYGCCEYVKFGAIS